MKVKVYLFLFLGFLISLFWEKKSLFAQHQSPMPPELLKKLLSTNKPIDQITSIDLSGIAIPSNLQYLDNEKYLIKSTKGLYIGIEGTGVIYKITLEKDTIRYLKQDLTKYAGDNFCAAHFSVKDKIYAFGGYGFWKTNGLLKVYNDQSKGWDVVSLIEERPNLFMPKFIGIGWESANEMPSNFKIEGVKSMPSLFWVDVKNKLVYVLGQRIVNESIQQPHSFESIVTVLDLNKLTWKTLGSLNRYGWSQYAALSWGLFIHESSQKVYIADLRQNKIFLPDSTLTVEMNKLNNDPEINIIYAIDSTLYFGNVRHNTIDSITISYKHLITKNETVYSPQIEKKNKLFKLNNPFFYYIILIILSVVTTLYLYIRKGVRKQNSFLKLNIEKTDSQTIFTEVEKSLIQLLIQKAIKNDTASIEDLNRITGVSSKAEPIKRKVRSEMIQSINLKWGLLNKSNEKLITSTRSIQDKRNREYLIKEKVLESNLIQHLVKE